jgi:hypothetical protein
MMNAVGKTQNQKNMKRIYVNYMIAVLLTGFMLTSCDSYLDIEPRQQISAESSITTGEDVQLLLISAMRPKRCSRPPKKQRGLARTYSSAGCP